MKRAPLTGLLAICVAACSGAFVPASGTPVASETSIAVPATSSVVPTTKPSPPPPADYPYTIPWPDDELETPWRYAFVAWDGTSRIDHGNKYTDQVTTKDGDLFGFGLPTTMSVAEFETKIVNQAAEWHDCEREPMQREPLEAGGSDGVFAVYECFSLPVLRWVGVHDGFGLFIGLILKPLVDTEEAIARFKEGVGALTWGPRSAPTP